MKDFTGLELCNWRNDRVEVHVTVGLTDGKLTFAGQDLGDFVEETWGDSDYEYWYIKGDFQDRSFDMITAWGNVWRKERLISAAGIKTILPSLH